MRTDVNGCDLYMHDDDDLPLYLSTATVDTYYSINTLTAEICDAWGSHVLHASALCWFGCGMAG